ncbi:helix-turn-helix domain-containing protein [Rhizobium mesoamericanum]|uniref:helix-turn-helix domain-containing protein n=1 Tax=Rhizobium mesoamericanum TaxID=1079800 RepID=UPI00042A048A|nr:AraC family transcriptional regulator [Rhizobium mesoamericanum]
MQQSEAYGERFGGKFGLQSAPVLITRTLRNSEIATTEIRSDNPRIGLTESIAREDAYLIGLQLRDYPDHLYWEDGKQAPRNDLRAGECVLYDLKRDPVVHIDKPFHSVHFYIPRSAFNAIADESDTPRIGELAYAPGAGVADATIQYLGSSLLEAFAQPELVSRAFLDHVTLAVAVHIAQRYGGMRLHARPKGGLASWQEKRAMDMIDANLGGDISLRELAAECGLSRSHFARAFRSSTGLSPHQWLLRRRVEFAKTMLKKSRYTICDVALASGFSDQSHFTRVFTRVTGVSPGVWRLSTTIA